MSATSVQSGSQSCVIGTEHTLTTTVTVAGVYVLKLDLSALVSGDVLEVRVKCMCRDIDTQRVAYVASFANAQSTPIALSVPVPIAADEDLDCSIKQVAGTGRAIPWNLLKL